jgi:hypothetical protein
MRGFQQWGSGGRQTEGACECDCGLYFRGVGANGEQICGYRGGDSGASGYPRAPEDVPCHVFSMRRRG